MDAYGRFIIGCLSSYQGPYPLICTQQTNKARISVMFIMNKFQKDIQKI